MTDQGWEIVYEDEQPEPISATEEPTNDTSFGGQYGEIFNGNPYKGTFFENFAYVRTYKDQFLQVKDCAVESNSCHPEWFVQIKLGRFKLPTEKIGGRWEITQKCIDDNEFNYRKALAAGREMYEAMHQCMIESSQFAALHFEKLSKVTWEEMIKCAEAAFASRVEKTEAYIKKCQSKADESMAILETMT